MCMMCDGYCEDEIHDHYDELIARFGWMVLSVGGGSLARPPWSYTIGLSRGFDHPELVVVGLPYRRAHAMLNGLSTQVAAGDQFAAGHTISDGEGRLEARIVEVHPLIWEGPLFVAWLDYYESRGLAPDQRALQASLEPHLAGPATRRWQPCLDDPECRVGYPDNAPNRHPFNQHRRNRKRGNRRR
jgi:Domain of unknown function (DUF4262)